MVFGISAVVCLQFLLGIGYPGYAGNSTEVRHGQLIAPWLLLLTGAGIVRLWQRLGWRRALAVGLAGIYWSSPLDNSAVGRTTWCNQPIAGRSCWLRSGQEGRYPQTRCS